jgi:hypothetical protein
MSNQWVGKFLAVVMAVILPASIMSAETHGAMLYTSSSAILNGTPVSRNTAVFAGDKIAVPAKSAVTISLTGSSILVPPESTVTFNGDSVSLEPQTAVAVTTTVGLAAQIGNIKIAPVNKSGKFQVGRFDGKIFVAAKQGSVLIAGLTGNTVVPEGGTNIVADPEQQEQNKCDDPDPNKRAKCCNDPDEKKRKECEAALVTTGGRTVPAATGVSVGELPTRVAVLIAVAVAGIAAGVAIATTGEPVSPIHP